MTVTQSQFESLITDRLNTEGWDIKKGDVSEILKAQAAIAHDLIAKGEAVPLRDLLKINPRYRPKQPKRTGVFFGEERTVAARPASVVLKATFLKAAKDAVPVGRAITRIYGESSNGNVPAAKTKPAPKAAKPAAAKPPARRKGAKAKPDPVKAARRRARA
jgi:hypothetical protein